MTLDTLEVKPICCVSIYTDFEILSLNKWFRKLGYLNVLWFLNASKYCGSVFMNDFVVLVFLVVADELLSNFQGIL